MEPDVLVGREQPRQLGTDDTDDVAKHWNKDHGAVESQNQTGTSRYPHRVEQGIEASKPDISCLGEMNEKPFL